MLNGLHRDQPAAVATFKPASVGVNFISKIILVEFKNDQIGSNDDETCTLVGSILPVIKKPEEKTENSEKKTDSVSSAELIDTEEIKEKEIITEINTENIVEEILDAENPLENSKNQKSSVSSSISTSSLTDEISAKGEKVSDKIKSKVPKFLRKKVSKDGEEKDVIAEFKTGKDSIDEIPETEPVVNVKAISRSKSNYDSSLLIKLDSLKLNEKCPAGKEITLKVKIEVFF